MLGLHCCEGFPLVAASRSCSAVAVLRLLIVLVSLVAEHRLQTLVCGLSSCGSQAVGHRLHSHGTQASLLQGMWGLPGSEMEAMSPALTGGFITTEPPRKP